MLAAEDASADVWREFRPRPRRVSLFEMARRMLWNPRLNETLFVLSCAERLVETPTAHSEDQILAGIARDLDSSAGWLVFRLVFVRREGEALAREVLFQSRPRRLADIAAR
ncbi:MAG: hypothetical protein AB1942_17135 [Pseudomonadota bacterium]